MISINQAKKFCKNYMQIENYEKAVKDPNIKWDCHHRFELKCPLYKPLVSELIANNLYYDRPAEELIFLTPSEHHKLHATYNNRFKGKKHSEETKKLMSLHGGNAFRGKHHTEEAKQKNRLAHLGKKHDKAFCEKNRIRYLGRKGYTNGISDKFVYECPAGFWLGRSHLGKSWKVVDGKRVYEK